MSDLNTKAQGARNIQVTQNKLAVGSWTGDLASPRAGKEVARQHGFVVPWKCLLLLHLVGAATITLKPSRLSGWPLLCPKKKIKPKVNYVQ